MDHQDHVDLLRGAVAPGGTWADLGSGTGAFTLALADLLGDGSTIHSVDLDAASLEVQREAMAKRFPGVGLIQHVADFRRPLQIPGDLDGIVMANSLHFVGRREQAAVLEDLGARHVRADGTVVVVEYDTDQGNQWVPFPFAARSWPAIARAAGLRDPRSLHRVPSRWLGGIYSVAATTPGRTSASRS